MRGLYWFRHDLRVEDNLALTKATSACTDGLLAVCLLPAKTWQSHHVSGCKVDLILRHLPSLRDALAALNIPLHVEIVETFTDSAQRIATLAQTHHVQAVYGNREYEYDEKKRDALAAKLLAEHDIPFHLFDESVLIAPGRILTGTGKPYTVFTPFKKSALLQLSRIDKTWLAPAPLAMQTAFAPSTHLPTSLPGIQSHIPANLWPAGLAVAKERLHHFVNTALAQYEEHRNYPAIDGTSKLAPYLHIGAISVKRCYTVAHAHQSPGADMWISELLWRDFYKHVSVHFPHVCQGKSFHREYDALPWEYDTHAIDAWKAGETGFPLVDAAMKQLQQTGWMHNRLRMLVAMFFTKLMHQDWHIGEQFFMEHLIDGDFSANNGGWQWSASTGTDAAPYFRIFNPWRQSEQFDPDGTFIKAYLPKLASLNAKDIHAPTEAQAKALGYPLPLIDYEKARKVCLARFSAFRNDI